MLGILLMSAIGFMIIQFFRLKKIQKHDRYLYMFCQLRRDTIDHIFNARENLSQNEYIALRRLSDALSTIIANYKNHKTVLFNFRLFVKHLDQVKEFEEKTYKISTDNQEIQNLLDRTYQSILMAFLAFTPFIRSEIYFRLVKACIEIVALTGIKSLRLYLPCLDEAKIKRNDLKHKQLLIPS